MIHFLLRLYPREFRERYGDEMIAFHRARLRESPSLATRVRIFVDHVMSAIALHFEPQPAQPRDTMQLTQDIRYAVRSLSRRPAFTAVVVLTIALGVGANAAIFSVVNGILLRPLPYPHADRLVAFGHEPPHWLVSEPQYLEYQKNLRSFESFSAYSQSEGNLATAEEPERVATVAVTLDFFATLEVAPLMGRTFAPDENIVNPPTVAIISHALWQRRLAGDPRIVGQTINYNGLPRTVVGVMPERFEYPSKETALWLPMRRFNTDSLEWGNHYLFVVGRTRPGVTADRARAEANVLAKRIMADHPETFDPKGAPLVPVVTAVRDRIVGSTRPYLLALLGAVGFVLLIVCANVANLLLARGEGRRREMAVRTALGASHKRLAAQLITESLVLALAGGAIGLVLAWAGNRALLALAPASLPRLEEIRVDWIVVAFSLGVSIAAGLVFGLAPAIRSSREAPAEAMKAGGRSAAAQSGSHRMRAALVVTEVALAMIMLTGAGMLLRSLVNLQSADLGFDSRGAITAKVSPNPNTYDDARSTLFYQLLLPRVRAIPGVRAAGAAFWLPVVDAGGLWGVSIEGRTYPPAQGPAAVPQAITPGYLQAMGQRLLMGRDFTDADREGAPLVAIVSKTFANTIWPADDPIGRRIRLSGRDSAWMTVVGVANDIRMRGFDDKPEPIMYWPHAQAVAASYFVPKSMAIVARTSGEPTAIVNQLRAAVHALDPAIPVSHVRTVDELVGISVASRRFSTALIGGFAALALLLAGIGIYGVISYAVSERTFEIGVRMALGAEKGSVLGLILRDGVRLALIGITIGVVGAAVLARAIQSMLVGVPTIDVVTMLGVAVVLASVAVLASLLPARRATAVSPTEALRGG